MRILVTGGAGFIGSHLCKLLLEQGHKVMSLDCLVKQVHPSSPDWPGYQPDHANLQKYFCSVLNPLPSGFAYALDSFNPDAVVHLAALVGVGQSAYQIHEYTRANVAGTANVLEKILDYNANIKAAEAKAEEIRAFTPKAEEDQSEEDARATYLDRMATALEELDRIRFRAPIKQVVIAGSMSSYGEGAYTASDPELKALLGGSLLRPPEDRDSPPGYEGWDPASLVPVPTPEDFGLEPTSVYAWSKAEQEHLALLLWRLRGQREGLDVKVARFFNVYGEDQALNNPYTGVAAIFATRAMAMLPPVIFEDGGQSRDFIHVSDVAKALVAIMGFGAPGGVYNVSTGIPTSILKMACLIYASIAVELLAAGDKEAHDELMDLLGKIQPTYKRRAGDIRHCIGDSTKLRGLGWAPEVGLEEGIRSYVRWIMQQAPDADPGTLNRATNELLQHGLIR